MEVKIHVLYLLIGLVFLASPVAAGVFGTLWAISRRRRKKLAGQLKDLREENRRLKGLVRDKEAAVDGSQDEARMPPRKRKRRRRRPEGSAGDVSGDVQVEKEQKGK